MMDTQDRQEHQDSQASRETLDNQDFPESKEIGACLVCQV
jgi:hypothetical protein